MRRMLGAGLAVLLLLAGCSGGEGAGEPAQHASGGAVHPAASGAATELYTGQVVPILKANCYRCHAGMNHRGGLNLQTQAGMMKGGKNGRDVIPGDPDRSLLVTLMRHQGPAEHPMPMPPAPRAKVSDGDIAVVARWVREGALMPADKEKP